MAAARAAFRSALRTADGFADFNELFELNPEVFEGWERTSIWLQLHERILARGAGDLGTAILVARLKLALRDYDGFLTVLDRLPPAPKMFLYREIKKVGASLRAERFPDFRRPKIFCIGLSKTGTTTLTTALRMLGFHAMHFVNSLTREVLRVEDAYLCDGLTDTPVCVFFEALYHMFPNSKFIYTVRALENWEASFTAHYRYYHNSSGFDGIGEILSTRGAATRGQERAAIYASLFAGHGNAIAAYRAFDARVRGFFGRHDASRLFELDIAAGAGWPQLCAFLDRPVPAAAFPWRNKTVIAGSG